MKQDIIHQQTRDTLDAMGLERIGANEWLMPVEKIVVVMRAVSSNGTRNGIALKGLNDKHFREWYFYHKIALERIRQFIQNSMEDRANIWHF